MFSHKETQGALIDTRPTHLKEKDYFFTETVAQTDRVNWQTKNQSAWRTFPIFDQQNSNQCVAFSIAKLMGIQHFIDEGEYIDFSKSHLYERRSNKPSAGMAAINAFEIVRKEGVTLEPLYPTKQINNDNLELNIKKHFAQVGEIFKIDNYLSTPIQDIDTVASIIQRTKKGVMTWFWGTYSEWDREVPRLMDDQITLHSAPVRHSVTTVDYFLHNGQKALLIEDSWGNRGIKGRRIITEDFFKKRNYYNGYLMKFVFSPVLLQQKFVITKPLQFGMSDEQVVTLQNMLKSEGLFPQNIASSGYYGAITAESVLKWQIKHRVDSVTILNQQKGHFFGPRSLTTFNKLYK